MNALENKAIDLALKEMQATVSKIENTRYRLNQLLEDGTNAKVTVNVVSKELNDIVDIGLHSVNEWLHALKNNH